MKLYFAPLQGITTAHFRVAYDQIFEGMDAYYAPFITATERKKSSRILFSDMFPDANDITKSVPQLLSNNGTDFRYFANVLTEMGYKEINWNVGCPYPMVRKKKRGSGILPYPDLIRSLLDEVCKDTHYDLTVKMRLGLYSKEEGRTVIDALNDYPIKGLTIHPRTADQMYTGSVDMDAFEDLYQRCKHNLTYNGDIRTLEDYHRLKEDFPNLGGIMIGRGALENPFLPSEIRGIVVPNEKKLEMIRIYHDAIFKYYESYPSKQPWMREKNITNKMKEFWSYTAPRLDSDGRYFDALKRTTTLDDYTTVVNAMLSPENTWTETL